MPNLVGIGNSQVPTNAMLGGLAYQDSVGEVVINKIKAKTGDTASDVFVYDTRKDSDGGAWRKKATTQSWYDEGASSTRGARKEFPIVAVIVIENNGADEPVITIYDGDDPNLSMWMVFHTRNASGGDDQRLTENYYAAGPYPIRKVAMLNGMMVDCQFRSSGHSAGTVKGVTRYNFITDSSTMITDEGTFKRNGNLGGERNTGRSYTKISTTDIVHTQCNDVAMTVLPNAPIDASTGLPVPTIAVATDGGVSVINNDGGVFDTVATAVGYVASRAVKFSKSGEYLYIIQDPSLIYSYKTSSFTTDRSSGTLSGYAALSFFSGYVSSSGPASTTKLSRGNDRTINIGHANTGLALLYPDYSYTSNGLDNASGKMICRVTKDFNTGWMHGDIKGAFLSDTDTTDLTRNNVLTVGTFASASGWTLSDAATPSITGGKLVFDGTSGVGLAQRAESPAVITSGLQYTVKFTVSDYASGTVRARVANSGYGPEVTANGTYYHSFVAGGTPTETVLFFGNSFNGKVDDVEIYLEDQDRSVNKNGLQVFGTIPKQVVATSAELVSYGPFSTLNRLRQYYNSDLTFGTNDFSIMFWVNHDGTDAHQTIVGRDEREFNIFLLSKSTYSRKIRIYAHDSSDSVQHFDSTAYPYPINSWTHICVNYTGGNTVSIYVDGVLDNSGTLNYNINNTTYALHVGVRNAVGNSGISFPAANCKIALLRISASAPSAEELKKIYSDEKCLFHEEAKCTLSGTSDAITGLGFDDTTDVLHAGTSSGRSEFQGLNRINNTTTAVTTEISASDGLVAEQ